jgi:hypothetical protein
MAASPQGRFHLAVAENRLVTGGTSVVEVGAGSPEGAVLQLRAVESRLQAAQETGDRVVIVAADLITVTSALAPIDDDPFAPSSVLVAADPRGDLVVRHHTVISGGTSFFETVDATHRSVGALVIAPADIAAARTAIGELREAVQSGEVAVTDSEIVEVVIIALVRSRIVLRAVEIVDVPWFRSPADHQQAIDATSTISDTRVRGLLANRVDDGFYSTFVVRKASKPLTRLALRLGWSPNTITAISFVIGLLAAAFFATGQWGWILVGAIALQLSLIVDCVDGEVARATRRFTALGAWLDAATDRVKEFAAYGGLAIGAASMGIDVWWIAITLIALQTTRHVADYDFARIQRLREASLPLVDIRQRSDDRKAARGGLAGAMQASARINRRSAVRWIKKVVHMPIGERWLLLSVLAVAAGPAWALGGLLIAGVVALAYVFIGRIARTLTWTGATPGDGVWVLRAQLDAGPSAAAIARIVPAFQPRMQGRFAWSGPALLRAFELTTIALLVTIGSPGVQPLAFWILFAIAYHHYDTLYRSLQGAMPPRWLTWFGLGWDGRIVVVGVITIGLAASLVEAGLTVLLGWWALWFAGVASIQWLRSSR